MWVNIILLGSSEIEQLHQWTKFYQSVASLHPTAFLGMDDSERIIVNKKGEKPRC
jgi:hypothetical protein